MVWMGIGYYLRLYKNWIISVLIFTILFWVTAYLSYVSTFHLLKVDKPLIMFLADSFSYTLFIYGVATLLGVFLVSLVRLVGFFRQRDIELLLQSKTRELTEEIKDTEETLQTRQSILNEVPIGIFMTQFHQILYANEWMYVSWGYDDKKEKTEGVQNFFTSVKEFLELEKRAVTALGKQKSFGVQAALTNGVGQKVFVQLTAYSLKPKSPKKGMVWFLQDMSQEMKNIELETYYQTVFRVMSILHIADEHNMSEEDILRQLLDEIIGIYGLKTGFYFRYDDKMLKFSFLAGEDSDFPNHPDVIDLSSPKMATAAIVKAVLSRKGFVYNDIQGMDYYRQNLARKNNPAVKSTFSFPIIINNKVEGVVSLYAYETGFFTDSLVFRLQQLNAEICKNIANIRARRKATESIRRYEECLRGQIHELETNKKIMQRQAGEVNAMIGDLILARDTAEKASRSKTEFLANISHELRTPLNAILGFSEAIEQETFGPLRNKQYKDYVGYILTSGRHLLSLINDVLDLSCVEVGRHKMNDEDVKIIPVVKDVISVISRYPGGDKRHITVESNVKEIILHADERSFKQIFLNVLSNAVKFTPENGKIDVNLTITDKGELEIKVHDNGVGIPKDKIGDLFQPFSQVENIMTREHEGSGLGLVLIKKLVELHQGRVWIQSDEGKGTTVFIVFPKARVVKTALIQKKGKK